MVGDVIVVPPSAFAVSVPSFNRDVMTYGHFHKRSSIISTQLRGAGADAADFLRLRLWPNDTERIR